jgi:hypothetical protein
MSVIWTDLGDGVFAERQARALKSALSDLMIASERDTCARDWRANFLCRVDQEISACVAP